MKINQAEFVISAVGAKQYPNEGLPEIALVGRSNVGKSSLINKLIGRKQLARTSSQPGKTQTLNFYSINQQFYFVDLPGYGYAKVSRNKQAEWGKFIEEYLLHRKQLILILLLIDIRHPPTVNDQNMYAWLTYHKLSVIVVVTKMDKISKNQINKHHQLIRKVLQVNETDPLVLVSAEQSWGIDELWSYIELKTKLEGKPT